MPNDTSTRKALWKISKVTLLRTHRRACVVVGGVRGAVATGRCVEERDRETGRQADRQTGTGREEGAGEAAGGGRRVVGGRWEAERRWSAAEVRMRLCSAPRRGLGLA